MLCARGKILTLRNVRLTVHGADRACCGIWLVHFYDRGLEKNLQYKACKLSQGIGRTDGIYSVKSCHNTEACCHVCIVWIVDIGRYASGRESWVTQALLLLLVFRARQYFRFVPICSVMVLWGGKRMKNKQPVWCCLLWIQTFLFMVMRFTSS